jgi:hypothetical protein
MFVYRPEIEDNEFFAAESIRSGVAAPSEDPV